MDTKIAIFRGREVRKTIHQDEWWFSVVDAVSVLTDSVNARDYWFKMKIRVKDEDGTELSTFCRQLKLQAPDGKMRETDCANTEGMFRIIQGIPSPKAEPFKRWLAKVGYERIKEIEDPELATKRTRAIYKAKGYSDAWIEKRMRGIEVREELTDEWQRRGVQENKEYAILTAEISKATFGMTPNQYRKFKMTGLELIFSMLGEASTTEIARNKDARGFGQNKEVAQKGGKIAGDARKKLEIESGKKVSTEGNYLSQPQNKETFKIENNLDRNG